jgi:hypothetical protein
LHPAGLGPDGLLKRRAARCRWLPKRYQFPTTEKEAEQLIGTRLKIVGQPSNQRLTKKYCYVLLFVVFLQNGRFIRTYKASS